MDFREAKLLLLARLLGFASLNDCHGVLGDGLSLRWEHLIVPVLLCQPQELVKGVRGNRLCLVPDAVLREELGDHGGIELWVTLKVVCIADDRLKVQASGQMAIVVQEVVR